MIKLIFATSSDGLIGNTEHLNGMPWNKPLDMQHFKKTTLHQKVLMGRKTFKKIGHPLDERTNYVLSHQAIEDVQVVTDLLTFLNQFKGKKKEDIYIIGGATLFEQTIGIADMLIVSLIKGHFKGDVYFKWNKDDFICEKQEKFKTFDVLYYVRRDG